MPLRPGSPGSRRSSPPPYSSGQATSQPCRSSSARQIGPRGTWCTGGRPEGRGPPLPQPGCERRMSVWPWRASRLATTGRRSTPCPSQGPPGVGVLAHRGPSRSGCQTCRRRPPWRGTRSRGTQPSGQTAPPMRYLWFGDRAEASQAGRSAAQGEGGGLEVVMRGSGGRTEGTRSWVADERREGTGGVDVEVSVASVPHQAKERKGCSRCGCPPEESRDEGRVLCHRVTLPRAVVQH
mmetsp:Transcript_25000/g.69731  ORF Transcript_25000/g.69731 Transcript_25000/m.69731 type:complete len:237 (-) Transcript_25000:1140-1850(-)